MIIEKAKSNYSAYCPKISGCIATGKTIEEVKKNMREAIKIHTQKDIELKFKIKKKIKKYSF